MPSVLSLLDVATVQEPWLLFLLAILETSFITGLFVPSGLATSIVTGIAVEEGLSLLPVAAAALAGGAIGDSVGFWVGRAGHERWLTGDGRFARRFRAVQAHSDDLIGDRPLLSVTLARMISFVRTAMPMAAGMSGLPYRRYLPYELLGLICWCGLYMTMGAAAGGGWSWAQRLLGAEGAVVAFAVLAVVVLVLRRRVRRQKRSA